MSTQIKDVFTVTERNGEENWSRIGVAFLNRDNSINVILDSVPLSGKLHIRDRIKKETASANPPRVSPRREQGISRSAYR